jgi:hypothetical protein
MNAAACRTVKAQNFSSASLMLLVICVLHSVTLSDDGLLGLMGFC